ncbi:hypothetical protein RJ639_003885 [Escallonia herrerae]|uniref:Protein kinase domain-containing protein n=1 Tax=Escallonia herrerae TaxID=1293975 RepID=A0AA88W4R8_9ASTE|nr:hypothetical protein RJ639_003885 [Escallonia herrerae]
MAAALECWSSRASTDEDPVEQVLMITHDRSESSPPEISSSSYAAPNGGGAFRDSSVMQKRFQRLSRNVSEAIASLKNSLNIDSARDPFSLPDRVEGCRKQAWGGVVRNLTRLYPGSQLPEKLVSNIRKHYDSLPLSYAQAGFEMKDVSVEDHPAIFIREVSEDESQGSVFKLTFACNSSVSWPAMSGALDNASIRCKKIQIFEKKEAESYNIETTFWALWVSRKWWGRELGEIEDDCNEQNYRTGIELPLPLPTSVFVVSVDEWKTVQSGREEIGKWLLNSDNLDFTDQIDPTTFKGVYKGKRVGIEKIKGCDKGHSYDFELRKDLLELMTCGHKNILQFYGVCIDENHGLCVVTKLMEGGSVHDVMTRNKKLQAKDIVRVAADIAEGIMFMIDHGVVYVDLNSQRILLDRNGNACLGDMGIVAACKGVGEAMEYETDGYRWLAPEIIAGDPETVSETWMSNVYSFGMVVWEMVTGEGAYSAYSPVQAAVGIAACGLRPDIPKECPQILRSLMMKCWNNSPLERPQFAEILSILMRPNNNSKKQL